ncbi:MAG: BLUF domain-containing protein [Pseudomonadota bacterium]
MYRLLYTSTAIESLSENQIGKILDVSVSNNYERYLTGFLAHNGRHFMQAIEGEEPEVKALYERILADDRHFGVVQLVGETITKRAFPDWAMNYYRVDGAQSSNVMLARHDDPVDNLLPGDMPRELLHIFVKFMNVRQLTRSFVGN